MNTGKEGHVVLYHKDCYPLGAIGPVSFLWRQNCHAKRLSADDEAVESTQLWIWAHPACFNEVFQAIQEACETITTTTVVQDCAGQDDDPSASLQEKKNSYCTNQDQGITVSSLRFDLARLHLTGPLSHSLLVSMLEIPAQNKLVKNDKCLLDDESNLIRKDEQTLPVQDGGNNTGNPVARESKVGVDEVKLCTGKDFSNCSYFPIF